VVNFYLDLCSKILPRVQVMDVNASGVLFTAQAAGRQMVKFKRPGSIILIASMSGSITNRVSSLSRDIVPWIHLALRTMRGSHITRANLLFCKWLVAWHANSDR
jgi:hypothetical protein